MLSYFYGDCFAINVVGGVASDVYVVGGGVGVDVVVGRVVLL